MATQVGEPLGLEAWSNLVASGGITGPPSSRLRQANGATANGVTSKGGVAPRSAGGKPHVDEATKKGLIKVLMQVYMEEGYVILPC
jgi:hypothetical protein